jgi:hypothetical protein
MKHTNQEETSKHRGAADQRKKANKGQSGRNESGHQRDQQSGGNKELTGSRRSEDSTNWQKEKQNNGK